MLAAIVCLALQTPQPVTPAEAASREIALRADTMDGLVGDKAKRSLYGYYIYATSRATVGGKAAYLVTMNYKGTEPGSFQSDTVAVDATSLSPLWHRFHGRGDSASVTYTGRHAKGYALQNSKNVNIDVELSPNAFDGALARWIIGRLPLAAGYRLSLTTFSLWRGTEATMTAAVTGAEVVELGSRKVDTWVVESASGMKRWYAKTTGELVQEHTSGSLGGKGDWLVKR
ncbi:MAG TPA: hypothetical protein VFU23_11150 [Gemmatimonadales bacterium]|nr:hypothetical protein [Gemmatimonadales bacterium]